jgi:hypothetical protein
MERDWLIVDFALGLATFLMEIAAMNNVRLISIQKIRNSIAGLKLRKRKIDGRRTPHNPRLQIFDRRSKAQVKLTSSSS